MYKPDIHTGVYVRVLYNVNYTNTRSHMYTWTDVYPVGCWFIGVAAAGSKFSWIHGTWICYSRVNRIGSIVQNNIDG
jgi:hypothetical protein